MKITIGQEYDGFYIVVQKEGGDENFYRFDQEDTVEDLVEVFKTLGFEASFEESY